MYLTNSIQFESRTSDEKLVKMGCAMYTKIDRKVVIIQQRKNNATTASNDKEVLILLPENVIINA